VLVSQCRVCGTVGINRRRHAPSVVGTEHSVEKETRPSCQTAQESNSKGAELFTNVLHA